MFPNAGFTSFAGSRRMLVFVYSFFVLTFRPFNLQRSTVKTNLPGWGLFFLIFFSLAYIYW